MTHGIAEMRLLTDISQGSGKHGLESVSNESELQFPTGEHANADAGATCNAEHVYAYCGT